MTPDLATENAALHCYRNKVQAEVVSLAKTLHDLARDAAEQLDKNGPALAFSAGAHAAYLAATRLAERILLLAEEAADKALHEPPDRKVAKPPLVTPDPVKTSAP